MNEPELHIRRFHKVLIANRGEIAMRITRACHELGISTVAIYSDADRHAPHVRFADEAYHIGPSPARESYLVVEKILDIARRSGADAVHPGYGFLAENAHFARACYEAGLVFIGPSPHAIEVMGDKLTARSTVLAAGVPVVPGTEPGLDEDDLLAAANQIGFPLLVKASAGGGGKGMRPVYESADLPDAISAAKREALAAFGFAPENAHGLLRPEFFHQPLDLSSGTGELASALDGKRVHERLAGLGSSAKTSKKSCSSICSRSW